MHRFILTILASVLFISSSFAYTVMPAEKTGIIKGYTRAANTMIVSAETAGRLVKIHAGMGHVSMGGVFAVIDPVFTELDIKSVRAALGKVDASAGRLAESVSYYKKEYDRTKSLYDSEVETESRRDAALHALSQAELSLGELEAERKSLNVQLEQLEEKLSRHYIKIPKGWSITTKPLEEGELVSAGQPITYAGDFRTLVVPVFLDNEEMRYLADRESFEVSVDGVEKTARLTRVSPAFDEKTRKREAEITIDMQGIGGMLVEIPVRLSAEGLMIDEKALINRYSNPRVKIKSSGKEVRVSVLGREEGKVLIADTPELNAGVELEAAAE